MSHLQVEDKLSIADIQAKMQINIAKCNMNTEILQSVNST